MTSQENSAHKRSQTRLEDIWAQLEIGPWKSQRQLSQEGGMSVGSASKAAKVIKFHPHRV
jgi:hypothetical protein